MKQYFKYQRGYVNIDSECLYLTSTGNWTEIPELAEKNRSTKVSNFIRLGANGTFLFVSVCLGIVMTFMGISQQTTGLIMLVGIPVGVYFLYRYFQYDLGVKYRIPLSKITHIDVLPNEQSVTIHFLNGYNLQDQETLKNVENKGFEILLDLNIKQ